MHNKHRKNIQTLQLLTKINKEEKLSIMQLRPIF